MKAYKGFNKDMTCRDFQYEEGKAYHTDKVDCCKEGFHACEYPLYCLEYYNPNRSVYHEVELSGEMDKDGYDSKVCATDIKIGARLSIAGLVKAAIDFTMSKAKPEKKSDENYGASSATGDCGASSATGDYGASSATGDCGASSATGYKGASSATGDYGASSATGDCGASSATGDYGASSATGNCSVASVTGYQASASTDNPTAVAVAWGHESKAKGCIGSHLVLADWEFIGEKNDNGDYIEPWKPENWKLNEVKLLYVDGEMIKADTYYRSVNGVLEEVL